MHSLQVTASDAAPDRRSTTLNVTIIVQDVQDVIPVFPQNLYVADVPENEANYAIVTVQVSTLSPYRIVYRQHTG